VPDIAINYELLHNLGQQTESLKNRLSDVRQGQHNFDPMAAGTEAGNAINRFYQVWNDAFKHAWNLLESLSTTYTTVAQQWFDQDAGFAATADQQALGFQHSMWQATKSEYDNWKKLSQTPFTNYGFDDEGNPYPIQTTLADPNSPPPRPGPEPTQWSISSVGFSQQTTSAYNSSGALTATDAVISDDNGFTYHEHTIFGDNGSYTSAVTTSDGTKITDTANGNPDGTGTRTVTTVDSTGKTTVQTYSGTGVNGSSPTWTETDHNNDNNDDNNN